MSEGGEHADAVDNAAANLKASGRSDLKPNLRGAQLIERKVKLANGLEISPGDISALMGDFYGAFTKGKDGKDHFDPAASFNALDNADPLEMAQLLHYIHQEKADVEKAKVGKGTFSPTNNALFELATASRNETTDAKGTTTGLSFIELAKKNTSHFGAPNAKNLDGTPNTDSFDGAYTSLHTMAISAAQYAATLPAGSDERAAAENRVLALEASSQHFLVDSFAGGHQFDKGQMVRDGGGGVGANIHARSAHNDGNENGVLVGNRRGEAWYAKGDGHWADRENAGNRAHAAEAIMDSYGDIDDVLTSSKTAADFVNDPAATAHERMPKFSRSGNDRTQSHEHDKGMPGLLLENANEIGLLPATALRAANKWWKKAWTAIGGETPAQAAKPQGAEQHPIDIVTFGENDGDVFDAPQPAPRARAHRKATARDHYKAHHHLAEDHAQVDVPHTDAGPLLSPHHGVEQREVPPPESHAVDRPASAPAPAEQRRAIER